MSRLFSSVKFSKHKSSPVTSAHTASPPSKQADGDLWLPKSLGTPGTLQYRLIMLDKLGREASPWHDVPLHFADGIVNVLCKTPKNSWVKYEVGASEDYCPLKVCRRRGKPAHFAKNAKWNLCMAPQTWASAEQPNEEFGGLLYDNKPVDIFDIGERAAIVGEVYPVKPLGAFAIVEGMGKLSWKLVGISIEDPRAPLLDDAEDLRKFVPGVIDDLRDWLRSCDFVGPEDETHRFGLNERLAGREVASQVLAQTHATWDILVQLLPPLRSAGRKSTSHQQDYTMYETVWAATVKKENVGVAAIPLSDPNPHAHLDVVQEQEVLKGTSMNIPRSLSEESRLTPLDLYPQDGSSADDEFRELAESSSDEVLDPNSRPWRMALKDLEAAPGRVQPVWNGLFPVPAKDRADQVKVVAQRTSGRRTAPVLAPSNVGTALQRLRSDPMGGGISPQGSGDWGSTFSPSKVTMTVGERDAVHLLGARPLKTGAKVLSMVLPTQALLRRNSDDASLDPAGLDIVKDAEKVTADPKGRRDAQASQQDPLEKSTSLEARLRSYVEAASDDEPESGSYGLPTSAQAGYDQRAEAGPRSKSLSDSDNVSTVSDMDVPDDLYGAPSLRVRQGLPGEDNTQNAAQVQGLLPGVAGDRGYRQNHKLDTPRSSQVLSVNDRWSLAPSEEAKETLRSAAPRFSLKSNEVIGRVPSYNEEVSQASVSLSAKPMAIGNGEAAVLQGVSQLAEEEQLPSQDAAGDSHGSKNVSEKKHLQKLHFEANVQNVKSDSPAGKVAELAVGQRKRQGFPGEGEAPILSTRLPDVPSPHQDAVNLEKRVSTAAPRDNSQQYAEEAVKEEGLLSPSLHLKTLAKHDVRAGSLRASSLQDQSDVPVVDDSGLIPVQSTNLEDPEVVTYEANNPANRRKEDTAPLKQVVPEQESAHQVQNGEDYQQQAEINDNSWLRFGMRKASSAGTSMPEAEGEVAARVREPAAPEEAPRDSEWQADQKLQRLSLRDSQSGAQEEARNCMASSTDKPALEGSNGSRSHGNSLQHAGVGDLTASPEQPEGVVEDESKEVNEESLYRPSGASEAAAALAAVMKASLQTPRQLRKVHPDSSDDEPALGIVSEFSLIRQELDAVLSMPLGQGAYQVPSDQSMRLNFHDIPSADIQLGPAQVFAKSEENLQELSYSLQGERPDLTGGSLEGDDPAVAEAANISRGTGEAYSPPPELCDDELVSERDSSQGQAWWSQGEAKLVEEPAPVRQAAKHFSSRNDMDVAFLEGMHPAKQYVTNSYKDNLVSAMKPPVSSDLDHGDLFVQRRRTASSDSDLDLFGPDMAASAARQQAAMEDVEEEEQDLGDEGEEDEHEWEEEYSDPEEDIPANRPFGEIVNEVEQQVRKVEEEEMKRGNPIAVGKLLSGSDSARGLHSSGSRESFLGLQSVHDEEEDDGSELVWQEKYYDSDRMSSRSVSKRQLAADRRHADFEVRNTVDMVRYSRGGRGMAADAWEDYHEEVDVTPAEENSGEWASGEGESYLQPWQRHRSGHDDDLDRHANTHFPSERRASGRTGAQERDREWLDAVTSVSSVLGRRLGRPGAELDAATSETGRRVSRVNHEDLQRWREWKRAQKTGDSESFLEWSKSKGAHPSPEHPA